MPPLVVTIGRTVGPQSTPALRSPQLLQGGNDYEIFVSEETVGHTVNGPADTIEQTSRLFL